MRTLLLSLLALLLSNGPLRAELLIYKETEAGFLAASPGRFRLTVRGYFAYDTVSGVMSEIGAATFPNGARYYIINTNFGQHSVTRVPTPPRDQLIIARAISSNDVVGARLNMSFVKGPMFVLPTGTGATFPFARSLKGLTRAIDRFEGQPAFSESTITMSFSLSETAQANESAESITDFLNRWRAEYERRGYQPLPTL